MLNKTSIVLVPALIFCIGILITQSKQSDESKIIDCRIVESNEKFRSVTCDKDSKVISNFMLEEWPKEWEDSTKFGQIVKIKVNGDIWTPFPSCEARRKQMEERVVKTKRNEFKLPLQLPIDKDCQ